MLKIDVDASEVIRGLENVRKASRKDAAKVPLNKEAKRIQSAAKSRVAVDTGALKRSIRIISLKVNKNGVLEEVKTGEPYAGIIEFGVKSGTALAREIGVRQPQPFFFPYVDQNEKRILNTMADEIGDNLLKAYAK